MDHLECDILVVGAGPAGSSAAMTAAARGLRVIVVERRPVVGRPVRCAEYVPRLLAGEVHLEARVVVQPVRAMRTMIPGRDVTETAAPGFMIERDLFDQSLSLEALHAGAQILLSTRALSRKEEAVLLRGPEGRLSTARPRVIVGADGPHSTVGAWIGLLNRNMVPAVQVRVPLIRPMDFTEVHFCREFFAGYGWLFPRGNQANVGLGMKCRPERPVSIRRLLEGFVDRLAREDKIKREPLKWTAGWIPAEPLRSLTRENMLLVGDAGAQTHPITGAGVAQAVISGRMAGQWAARAVETGDLALLREYEREWAELYGESHARDHERRQLLEREWERLEHVIRYCWVAFREYYGRPG